jgi:hypothetical protein
MSEIFSNQIVLVAVSVVVGVVLTTIGAVVVLRVGQAKERLFREKQGYPGEDIVEPAVQPYIEALWPFAVKAVVAVFKASQRARDSLEDELADIDKAALARRMYQMLPDAIFVGGKLVPISIVKAVVTEDQWAVIVQNVFDSLMSWYRLYDGIIDDWVEEMLPDDDQEG